MDQKIDFTTPVWLANTWTVNGFLTMITSSFGMYIVWFKSSKEMVQYKHFLSSIVAFTTMFDIGMNHFFRPIALFPLWGGFTDGEPARLMGRIMKWMGILDGDVTYLMPVVQVLCYEALVSLVCGFFYRYLALQRDSFILRSLLRVYAFSTLIHIGTTFPCPIFCVLARSPRKEMVQYILEKHPEYSAIVNHTMWVIIDPDIGKGNPWSSSYGYCCLFMCSGYLLMGVTTVYLILNKLNAMKAHMSEKTFQIHKNLLISLCWQSMVPMVMYFVPLLLGQVVIRFGFRGNVQDWMNIFTAVMGTHSMVNTCIMIYFTRPYREFTIQLLNRLGLFRKKTTLGVHPQKDKVTRTSATLLI